CDLGRLVYRDRRRHWRADRCRRERLSQTGTHERKTAAHSLAGRRPEAAGLGFSRRQLCAAPGICASDMRWFDGDAMATLINRLRRSWRCESGAELIEFALTFPLLLLVVMGIIEFGFMFRDYEVITNAAREGARVRVLPAYSADDATARVNAYLDAAGLVSAD